MIIDKNIVYYKQCYVLGAYSSIYHKLECVQEIKKEEKVKPEMQT